MTTLSDIQRGALGLATTDSPTFNGLSIDTTAGVDGQWNTTGLTIYANAVTPQHDGPLHVMSGTAGAVTADSVADEIVVENSGDAGISILVPDASQSAFFMGTPTQKAGMKMYWDYTLGVFQLGTNKAGATMVFRPDAFSKRGEWNTTGLTCFASGVTAQHDGVLHVMGGSAGAVTASTSANELILEGDTQTGMTILCPDANNGLLYFGNASNNTACQLQWDYDGNTNGELNIGTNKTGARIKFTTGLSTEALILNSDQTSTFANIITVNPSVGNNARATAIALTVSSRANFTTHVGQYNPSISTVAAILDVIGTDAVGIVTVRGEQAGNKFADCVFFHANGAVALNSGTVGGTPSARTYSVNSGILRLAMTSGTYTVAVGGTLTYQ